MRHPLKLKLSGNGQLLVGKELAEQIHAAAEEEEDAEDRLEDAHLGDEAVELAAGNGRSFGFEIRS